MGNCVDAQPFPEPVTAATSRFINRELSWLEFDARVLALAEDPARPLLERVKFVAIYSAEPRRVLPDQGLGPRGAGRGRRRRHDPRRHDPARSSSRRSASRSSRCRSGPDSLVLGDLLPALEKERIRLVHWDQLAEADREFLGRRFRERIFPVLTPLSVDPSHPFPYISNLSLNLAAVDPRSDDGRAPVRAGEDPAAAAPVHRPARRRALRATRGGRRGAPGPALPGHGHRRACTCSA